MRRGQGQQQEADGGHSPETQRDGIKRAAREYGYLIDDADIFEDTRRGHILKRKGYQAIIRGIEEGQYAACFVYLFDRLGRAPVERVARAHDWDKRGVLLISVMVRRSVPVTAMSWSPTAKQVLGRGQATPFKSKYMNGACGQHLVVPTRRGRGKRHHTQYCDRGDADGHQGHDGGGEDCGLGQD